MNDTFVAVVVLALTFGLGAATMVVASAALDVPVPEQPLWSGQPKERSSPSDTLKEDQIRVYRDGVEVGLEGLESEWEFYIDIDDPTWSTFTDTNSMDPVLDQGANTVRVKVPPEELQEGDIISYRRGDTIIIHRIVHKDTDEQGLYFVLKGDNNPANDPGKVRPDQILGKVVAILY
ncbi:MAG: signal peptidase I [Candidatus Woesearchaeota archaeon]